LLYPAERQAKRRQFVDDLLWSGAPTSNWAGKRVGT
jgi:hypothetical protein